VPGGTFWFEEVEIKIKVKGSGQECPLYTPLLLQFLVPCRGV
jgi:hypothetical protein